MPSDTSKRWIIQEASDMVNRLEPLLLPLQFRVALLGEVLLTGRGKEMNLLLVPLLRTADPATCLPVIVAELQPTNVACLSPNHWMLYLKGKYVDILGMRCILP